MSTDLETTTGGQTASVHRLTDDRSTGGTRLNDWSALRDESTEVHGSVSAGHHQARELELNKRTLAAALRDPRDLLEELAAGRGLSWSTIAQLVGVTDTAIRKWRRGTPISGDNRRSLASALVFLDLVGEALNPLHDASSWLELPLADNTSLTPVDIYAKGGVNLLLDWASGRLDPNQMLDQFDSAWRSTYASDDRFGLVHDEDGMPILVERASGT